MSKSSKELNKDFIKKYNEIKNRKIVQANFLADMLNSYRVIDDETSKKFDKEIKVMARLNDQYNLLDEILTSKSI